MKTKKKIIKELEKLIKENELSYDEFNNLCKEAREITGLKKEKKQKVNKPVPSIEACKKFLNIIESQDIKDSLMIKMLIYLGIRSIELVNIKIEDLDLAPGEEKVFLHRKAGLDKWIVLPEKIASLIRIYLNSNKKNLYLFESSYHNPYSTRAIRLKIQKYREIAGLPNIIHAHNFRHLLLTSLATQGWSDSELQLVSGHDARTSLDRYIYKNPEIIRHKINNAINNLGI